MAKQTRTRTKAAATSAPVYQLTGIEQSVLESLANRVSKQRERRNLSVFNVAITGDEHGTGHALCEVSPDGTMVRHWGGMKVYVGMLQSLIK